MNGTKKRLEFKMKNLLLVLILLSSPAIARQDLGPRPVHDPLQKVTWDVLNGKYNPVPVWKLAIYQKIWNENITVSGKARKTTYCRKCAGKNCADGSPVRNGVAAASKNIPMHSVVWIGCSGLKLITDRGGKVTVKKGRNADFDVWVPRCPVDCWRGPGTISSTPWAMIIRGDGKNRRNSFKNPINIFERGIGKK